MREEIKIIELTKDSPKQYFHEIVQIHKAEINQGFLIKLGNKFLFNLYSFFAESKNVVILAALSNNNILGFICVSTDTKNLYKKFIIKKGVASFFIILPKLFSFKIFKKILEVLFYPRKKNEYQLPKTEILNFCVKSSYQGMGIGKKLFYDSVDRTKTIGIKKIKIVTGSSQISAQKFYGSVGAKKISKIEVHKNIESIVYVYEI